MSPSRRIEYHAPEGKLIDRFARQVCRELGEVEYKHGDVRDFAKFLKHLSSAVAHWQNESAGGVDNDLKTA